MADTFCMLAHAPEHSWPKIWANLSMTSMMSLDFTDINEFFVTRPASWPTDLVSGSLLIPQSVLNPNSHFLNRHLQSSPQIIHYVKYAGECDRWLRGLPKPVHRPN